jgi:hypothetical protein
MGYNENDRSELERRFETLFSQVFQCPWQEHLKAQYAVHVDGRTYFIDYVYEGVDEKIGIELDGRDKFFRFKQVFYNFFRRQNALQLAGIQIYRFTWGDVVDQDGWRAHQQLHQIFKGRILTPLEHVTPVETVHNLSPQQFPLVVSTLGRLAELLSHKPKREITAITRRGNTLPSIHQQEEKAEAYYPALRYEQPVSLPTGIEPSYPSNVPPLIRPKKLETYEYQPWPPRQSHRETPWQPAIRAMGLLGGLLALSLMVIWIAGLNSRPAPAPQEETKITQSVSAVTQTQKSRIRINQAGLKLNQARTVAAHAQMGNIRRIPKPPTTNPVLAKPPKTAVPVEKVESLPPALSHPMPQELPKPAIAAVDAAPPEVKPSPVPDEIVAFNQASGIYHKPNSYWARKCTRNCIYIPKSQAIQMGGRASQADR